VTESFDAQAAADLQRRQVIERMGTIEEVQARVQAAVAPFIPWDQLAHCCGRESCTPFSVE
jgi:hypothetical protein